MRAPRKRKGTIAAMVGLATGARGAAARAQQQAHKKAVGTAVNEGLALDSKEMAARVRTALTESRSAASKQWRESRAKANQGRAEVADARHVQWQKRADSLWRKNPHLTATDIAKLIVREGRGA